MAIKAFKDKKPMSEKLSRTAYDMSFQNNLTLRYGRLTPFMCKEVIPGDGVRINPELGLNFLPMVFPVQTRIYAKMYFFYVRNRAIHDGFKEFITNTPDNTEEIPYIDWPNSPVSLEHGSLADYLGIPTSIDSMVEVSRQRFNCNVLPLFDIQDQNGDYFRFFNRVFNSETGLNVYGFESDVYYALSGSFINISDPFSNADSSVNSAMINSLSDLTRWRPSDDLGSVSAVRDNRFVNIPFTFQNTAISYNTGGVISLTLVCPTNPSEDSYSDGGQFAFACFYSNGQFDVITNPMNWSVTNSSVDGTSTIVMNFPFAFYERYFSRPDFLGFSICKFAARNSNVGPLQDSFLYSFIKDNDLPISEFVLQSGPRIEDLSVVNWLDRSASASPIYNGDLKISALPFRAYESIYNAYFRNQNVDRFMINGAPKYNQFVTTKAGGADNTPYDFFNVNWERDFLTTCLPEPQQGDAPLVGVTGTGSFVFDNGDGTTSTVIPTYGNDGRLTGISQYDPEAPESALKRVLQYVSAGMSINDFRNCNSLQRYLEENMIHGYRYKDLMKAHYGEDIHYNELDMPEYIGGVSRIVNMDKILNNNASGDKPLGDFAGLASMFSSAEKSPTISCHCDEHGFIIGLVCIMPVPVYTQVLPKHFLKHHFLDYYNPKFANIGYQPVSYSEITPNEKYAAEGVDGLSDTFGYQRPWYDYLGSIDEAHGLFRGQLENYVLRRKFAQSPVLGHDFISMDNSSLNNVFASNEQTDKILGQIYLNITMKRRIPRFNVPRLE